MQYSHHNDVQHNTECFKKIQNILLTLFYSFQCIIKKVIYTLNLITTLFSLQNILKYTAWKSRAFDYFISIIRINSCRIQSIRQKSGPISQQFYFNLQTIWDPKDHWISWHIWLHTSLWTKEKSKPYFWVKDFVLCWDSLILYILSIKFSNTQSSYLSAHISYLRTYSGESIFSIINLGTHSCILMDFNIYERHRRTGQL